MTPGEEERLKAMRLEFYMFTTFVLALFAVGVLIADFINWIIGALR